jgi:hypothetical protein
MRLSAAAVLVAVLTLAAGGGRADALTAPAYRSSADAVCARANARIDALGTPRSDSEIRAWLRRAVPVYARGVARLRALEPPRALRARHARWTAALAARLRVARALRARVDAGVRPAVALEAARPRLERLRGLGRARARALGLRACAGRPAGGR